MGTIYYNLGYLGTDEVVECSAVDLIGEYVGQTRPKTRAQLDMAVGKVLLVDDAFQLLKGHFALEALQELVSCLASDRYSHKMVVILAGYTEEMKFLMKTSGALTSLFPNEVFFKDMKAQDCLRLLDRELDNISVTAPFLKDENSEQYGKLSKLMRALSLGPSWGNARDIMSLAKTMKSTLFKEFFEANRDQVLGNQAQSTNTLPALSAEQAISCVKEMIQQRRRCMTPKAFPFDPEPELSNDDLRFARAFAFADVPILSIRVHTVVQEAQPRLLQAHRSVLDEFSTPEDIRATRPQAIQTTIYLTTSMSGLLGYPMSSGLGYPSIHASDDLLFQRPSAAYEQAYREIEELDDESDHDASNALSQNEPPSLDPELDHNTHGNLTIATQDPSVSYENELPRDLDQLSRVIEQEIAPETTPEKSITKTSRKDQFRRQFGEVLSEETKRALKDMNCCSQGFAWKRDLGRHVCAGGTHYMYDKDLRNYMDSNGY
jgi:hypothetical protein